jgi:hypothetical protein
LDPNYAFGFAVRGYAYSKKGNGTRAIADFTEARRLDPNIVSDMIQGVAGKKDDNNTLSVR